MNFNQFSGLFYDFLEIKLLKLGSYARLISLTFVLDPVTPLTMAGKEATLGIPQEIWIKIFSYLPYHEVLQRISPVCKYFKQFCHDVNAKKQIQLFSTTRYDFEYAKRFFYSVKNLTKLHVKNYLKEVDLVIAALKSSENLKELKLEVDYDIIVTDRRGEEHYDVDFTLGEYIILETCNNCAIFETLDKVFKKVIYFIQLILSPLTLQTACLNMETSFNA